MAHFLEQLTAFGPALSGILIAAVGLGWAFIFNALTYLVVTLALLLMKPGQLYTAPPVPRRRGQIREGLTYAMSRTPIRTVLVILAVWGQCWVLWSRRPAGTRRLGAYGWLPSCSGSALGWSGWSPR